MAFQIGSSLQIFSLFFFTFWLKFGRKRGLLQVINDLNESNA